MFHIDSDFIQATLGELVSINSVNPTLDSSSPGEGRIAEYLANVLSEVGLRVDTFEPEPGRVSVTGTLGGRGGGRSLMLNAHVDTVGVEGMTDPFKPVLRNGRLYGRGAYDMKGALAACIGAAKALRDEGVSLAGDVVVAAVADEEYASIGTSDLVTRVQVDGAIVTEPTQMKVCLAHKGFVWINIRVEGRAAHGSRFNEGVDANMKMGRVLGELSLLEERLRTGAGHPLVGPPSLHAALVRGGSGISTYAAECELQIERRTVPGETTAHVNHEIAEVIERARAEDDGITASHEILFARDPFEVAPEADVVGAVERAAGHVLGKTPDRMGDTPWMDSALLAAAGVETVVIGPIGGGAHAAEEWVDVQSVIDLAGVLAESAAEYCG